MASSPLNANNNKSFQTVGKVLALSHTQRQDDRKAEGSQGGLLHQHDSSLDYCPVSPATRIKYIS